MDDEEGKSKEGKSESVGVDNARIYRDVKAANSPFNLTIIFSIGSSMILMGLINFFPNEKYNLLSILLGIWMILWGSTLLNLKYDEIKHNFHFQLPSFINNLVPLERCEDGGFELVTIFHFVGYLIVGYIVPDLYGEILLLSIGFEVFESAIGFTPKIILDPTINLLGYTFGSSLHHSAINSSKRR